MIALGALSLRGGFQFQNYVKSELLKQPPNFAPFVSIIAPCRGIDDGLRENLGALFCQNFPNYEIIFVVDNEKDAAFSVIENVRNDFADSSNVTSKIIVAGKAENCGQKVHNLREAVLQVDAKSRVFAFVDSDARPNKNWLRHLIAPLIDENIGASTGYRWFVSKNFDLCGQFRSVWNASIASALGADINKNFCWGGATAIRRETFEKLDVREKWRGAVSDDFALTNALQTVKMPIYFVPQCLTASLDSCSFVEMIEFTTRQMKITRVYKPEFWKASFIGSILFTTTFFSGVLIVITRAVYGLQFWFELVLIAIIFALGAAKSLIRLNAVKTALPEYKNEIDASAFWHFSLWTFTPILYFCNGLSAAFSRKILWRGILYEMQSPTETIIYDSNSHHKVHDTRDNSTSL